MSAISGQCVMVWNSLVRPTWMVADDSANTNG